MTPPVKEFSNEISFPFSILSKFSIIFSHLTQLGSALTQFGSGGTAGNCRKLPNPTLQHKITVIHIIHFLSDLKSIFFSKKMMLPNLLLFYSKLIIFQI